MKQLKLRVSTHVYISKKEFNKNIFGENELEKAFLYTYYTYLHFI